MKKILLLACLFTGLLSLLPGKAVAQYCIPKYSSGCSGGDSIYYFQLGTFVRTSGCSSKVYKSVTYPGYDSTGAVIPVFRGKTYPLHVAVGATSQNFAGFIDYNRDGDFDDSSELVINDNSRTDSLNTVINIPKSIKPGRYAFRLMSAYSTAINYLNSTSSCLSTLTKGETEDYILDIKAPGTDVSLDNTLSPYAYSCSGSQAVRVIVRNAGRDSINNIPVFYKVNGKTYSDTLKASMAMDKIDTFTFSIGVSLPAGTFPFTAYTALPNDSDMTNDTIKGTLVVSVTPATPTTTGFTRCGPGSDILTAHSSTAGTKVHWFASTTSDTDLFVGDTFNTPKITSKTTYYAESQVLKQDSIRTDTALTSGIVRSNAGNMFDITAKSTFTIDSFMVTFFSAVKDVVEVYYKQGTYVGYEAKASAWTLAGSATVTGVAYSSGMTPVHIRFAVPFIAGKTYGMYVRLKTNNLAYDVGSKTFTNADMTLNTGISLPGKFGTPIVPKRNWNGQIFYHIKTCPSARVATVADVKSGLIGGATVKQGTPFRGKFSLGTAAKPDYVCAGDSVQYQLTPPKGLTNANYDSAWTISFLRVRTLNGYNAVDTSTVKPTSSTNAILNFIPSAKLADSTFVITMRLTNLLVGCDSIITRYIYVAAPPSASFSFTSGCLGSSVVFTNLSSASGGGKLTYSYDFGDKTSSTSTSPSHSYSAAGTYSVTLTATSSFGCTSDTVKKITVAAPPKANFSATTVCLGNATIFTDSATSTSGTIASYSWDFGDGSSRSSSTAPKHTYATSGTFKAKQVVTSTNGCADSITKTVTVLNGPVADFSFTNTCTGDSVRFTNKTIAKGGGVSYTWDFGDKTSSTIVNPAHKYSASSSSYTVKLSASNGSCADTVSKTITLTAKPLVNFGYTAACNNETVSFIDSSFVIGGGTYVYTFGDGNSSTSSAPSHTYSSFSSFNVKLVLTSTKSGCVDSMSRTLTLTSGNRAKFSFTNACTNGPTVFTNTNVTTGTAYTWDFGDGTTASVKDTTHAYAKTGALTVTLYSKNATTGCNDTFSQKITVLQSPTVSFTFKRVAGMQYSFTPKTSALSTFLWNFGDSTTDSKNINANHTYKNGSSHVVTLSGLAANGCVTVAMDTIPLITAINAKLENIAGVKVYPNPFKDNTVIFYTLDKAAKVELNIYDMSGRLVAHLSGANELEGPHSVVFDPTVYSAKSGVYVLKMTVGESGVSKQLIYVK
jgi:PKD repeat protein